MHHVLSFLSGFLFPPNSPSAFLAPLSVPPPLAPALDIIQWKDLLKKRRASRLVEPLPFFFPLPPLLPASGSSPLSRFFYTHNLSFSFSSHGSQLATILNLPRDIFPQIHLGEDFTSPEIPSLAPSFFFLKISSSPLSVRRIQWFSWCQPTFSFFFR